jgi:hypothetical protein
VPWLNGFAGVNYDEIGCYCYSCSCWYCGSGSIGHRRPSAAFVLDFWGRERRGYGQTRESPSTDRARIFGYFTNFENTSQILKLKFEIEKDT